MVWSHQRRYSRKGSQHGARKTQKYLEVTQRNMFNQTFLPKLKLLQKKLKFWHGQNEDNKKKCKFVIHLFKYYTCYKNDYEKHPLEFMFTCEYLNLNVNSLVCGNFCHVEKWLKAKVNFKIYDVINWVKNDYNYYYQLFIFRWQIYKV